MSREYNSNWNQYVFIFNSDLKINSQINLLIRLLYTVIIFGLFFSFLNFTIITSIIIAIISLGLLSISKSLIFNIDHNETKLKYKLFGVDFYTKTNYFEGMRIMYKFESDGEDSGGGAYTYYILLHDKREMKIGFVEGKKIHDNVVKEFQKLGFVLNSLK